MYMLDTDTCIYILKKKPQHVYEKFEQVTLTRLAISVITYFELAFGVECSTQKASNLLKLKQLTDLIKVEPLTLKSADDYAFIRALLRSSGQMIGKNDLLIAAHAKSLNYTLITNNTKEFQRVPHLKIENWVRED